MAFHTHLTRSANIMLQFLTKDISLMLYATLYCEPEHPLAVCFLGRCSPCVHADCRPVIDFVGSITLLFVCKLGFILDSMVRMYLVQNYDMTNLAIIFEQMIKHPGPKKKPPSSWCHPILHFGSTHFLLRVLPVSIIAESQSWVPLLSQTLSVASEPTWGLWYLVGCGHPVIS